MVYEQYYPFAELKLEYEDNALEPNIGRCTVFFHYNEHYLPTLKKLNEMVLEQPQAQNISLENLAHWKEPPLPFSDTSCISSRFRRTEKSRPTI